MADYPYTAVAATAAAGGVPGVVHGRGTLGGMALYTMTSTRYSIEPVPGPWPLYTTWFMMAHAN